MDRSVEQLRDDPGPIAEQSMATIIAHYDRIIRRCPDHRSSWGTRSAACSPRPSPTGASARQRSECIRRR
ncbi:hypothetical protein NKG94_45840 [Micromonospora sp. M12]